MALAEVQVLLLRSLAAGLVDQLTLRLPAGSTAVQALTLAGWDCEGVSLGIWGRKVGPDAVLREGDRLELYRPLTVDPMQARHRRHALQGRRIVSRHRPQPR